MEGSAMSQVRVDAFELCDNLSNAEALTAQTQNLNETLPLPQNDEGGTCSPARKTSLDNNCREEKEEVETGVEDYSEGSRDVVEDEDEVMKEEEEESEASSSLRCCQSPDTPMTDSSFSETGSLLETLYPFSPGTSPEPTSPVIPVISPECLHPSYPMDLSLSREEVISSSVKPGLDSSAVESLRCVPASVTQLDSRPDPGCTTLASGMMLKDSCPEQRTSPREPVSSCGPSFTAVSSSLPVVSTKPAPTSGTTEASTFSTATRIPSSSSPASSNQEQFTSSPVAGDVSVSTCSTGSTFSPAFLASLEQMAERDDDAHLPQRLHQIAETFVLQKDYQRALLFIQLEQLYHQRVLENLNALQEQWVSRSGGTSPEPAASHLDSLKLICQTHSRPRTRDAEVALLDNLSLKFDGGVSRPSCISRMEQRAEDSSCPATLCASLIERLSSPETDRELPDGQPDRMLYGPSELTQSQDSGREVEGGVDCTTSAPGNGPHPPAAGAMDRSNPAEQQEEDLGPAREAEAREEEEEEEISEVEEAAEALEMEDEGTEDDGEEQRMGPAAPSVETLVSGAELQLHREAPAQEQLQSHQETQEVSETCLNEEALPSQEADPEQREQYAEEREEEEDYDADFTRRAPSLDDMAKLITVEEVSPASGLVSILKKQSVYVEHQTRSTGPEPRPDKATARRRVRFKVPDEGYDQDVGGGDSCLLLFLLCLVTVVISIGGTALYCALGDAQSSVCQDFSRNADFYVGQMRRGITRLQRWYSSGL